MSQLIEMSTLNFGDGKTYEIVDKKSREEIGKKINNTDKGKANGVATLDKEGKVPQEQLPPMNESIELGETEKTAYPGNKGKIAYDHAQLKGKAFVSGLYKITTNKEGHVTSATPVTQLDIVALGIPDNYSMMQLLDTKANVIIDTVAGTEVELPTDYKSFKNMKLSGNSIATSKNPTFDEPTKIKSFSSHTVYSIPRELLAGIPDGYAYKCPYTRLIDFTGVSDMAFYTLSKAYYNLSDSNLTISFKYYVRDNVYESIKIFNIATGHSFKNEEDNCTVLQDGCNEYYYSGTVNGTLALGIQALKQGNQQVYIWDVSIKLNDVEIFNANASQICSKEVIPTLVGGYMDTGYYSSNINKDGIYFGDYGVALHGINLGSTLPDVIKNDTNYMRGVYYKNNYYHIADTLNEVYHDQLIDVGRIGMYRFNGKEDFSSFVNEQDGKTYFVTNVLEDLRVKGVPVLCTHFTFIENSSVYYSFDNSVCEYESLTFNIDDRTKGKDVEWFKNELSTRYQKGNPVTIFYLRKDPTVEYLTGEQVEQRNDNFRVGGINLLTAVNSPFIELEYIADTKEYTAKLEKKHDNEIQQLKTAIVALGGVV